MSTTDEDVRSVPDLVRDLLRAVFGLARSTARMAGLEARQILPRLGQRVALLVGASVVAATGLLLLLGGLVLVAERFLGLPKWAGALIAGLVTLGAGAAGIVTALRRLGDADLAFPETIAELSKDAEALDARRGQP